MDEKTDKIEISVLLDVYGALLTDRQRELTRLNIDMDMSLQEVAEEYGISRQGVKDAVSRAETALREYENAVGAVAVRREISLIAQNALKDGEYEKALKRILEILKK